jgi:hypothetical protein
MAARQLDLISPPALSARLRELWSQVVDAFRHPDRWILLSSCDWYPDGTSYPTNHAALLSADETDRTKRS